MSELNPTLAQIELYKKLREITENYHLYADQMMAIAVFIDSEFTKKKNILPANTCIIRNRQTGAIFVINNLDESLKVATEENLKDAEHPSFDLYYADKDGKYKSVAVLHRDFGHPNLYWKFY